MAKKAEIEQTEIEAPYELPEGWSWCRLGDVCEKIKRGKSPKYTDKSKILVFAQKCNQPDGTMSLEKALFLNEELLSKYKDDDFVKDGDILINSTGTGTIGRVGYFDKALLPEGMKLVPDTHVTTVRACADNASKFFYYFIKQKESYLELKGVGTTNMKELHADVLENLSFPLPPTLAEQQRIVNRIEAMFAKLDQAQEKAQAVLDSFEIRKAAILHKAFTGELTANWRKENGVPDDSWEEKTIGELYVINPKIKADDDIAASFIPMEKIEANAVNRFSFELKPWGSIKKNHTQFQDGDVCFAKISPCFENGKAFIAEGLENGIGAGTTELIILRNADIDTHFTFYLVTDLSFVRGGCATYSGTVGQQRINMDYVRNYKVSLPSLPEQQEIVLILDTVLEKESRAKEAAQTVLDQIVLLKKSILARAFRGEL